MARTKFGSFPSYRLYKRTGQAVVTIEGHDHYLGEFGRPESKAEYDRLIAEWLARGRISPPSTQSDGSENTLTVTELILAFKRHADVYYHDSPKEREKIRLAMRPLRRLYGQTAANEFRPLALQAVRNGMLQLQHRTVCRKPRPGVGAEPPLRVIEYILSRRTINQRLDIIKRMFKWAVAQELVPSGIYEALRAVEGLKRGRTSAKEPRRVTPVSDEQVDRTIPFVNPHIRGMISFQRHTGARSGEICVMRLCDIDMSGSVWAYVPRSHKNDHRDLARIIYIGPRAQEVLKPFLEEIKPDDYVFSPRRMMEDRYRRLRELRKSNVPPSQTHRTKKNPNKKPGGRYTAKAYYHGIRRGCKRAGIEPWHPHQLRHAAATRVRKEYGVELARIILGHKTAFTTEIYAEVDQNHAKGIVAKIG